MANTLWTPEQAARSTLAALRYLTTLPRTVRQDFSADFVPGVGNVVNIKNPITAGTARTYTAANRAARDAIVFDDLGQNTIPITITNQVYKAVRLPDDFATFDLVSLEQQVLRPQAESVVDGVTAPLVAKMNAVAIPAVGTVPLLLADGSNALDVLIALRAVLNGKKVPMTDRFFAITPQAEAAFLKLDQLQKVNEAGSDGVLRDATLGRLMGFTIVVDPNLTRSVAYHRDAFALVTRPSRIPEGAAKAAVVSQDGFALRWLQHYNPLQLEDQSVVDVFVGAETLDANRAVAVANPA